MCLVGVRVDARKEDRDRDAFRDSLDEAPRSGAESPDSDDQELDAVEAIRVGGCQRVLAVVPAARASR